MMNRVIISTLCLSYLLFTNLAYANKNFHNHSHKHNHGTIEVTSFPEIPSLKIEIVKDSVSGWNLHLVTKNFKFSPEHVNMKPVQGEGHAHLYVDGEKRARLYGPWFHIGNLLPGKHTIRVTLNANNHDGLVFQGHPIEVSKNIIQ